MTDQQPHVLNRIPSAFWILLLVVGTILRCGVGVYRATDPLIDFARSFPEVTSTSYKLYSVLASASAAVVGATTPERWTALHLVLVAGLLGATFGWAKHNLPVSVRRPLVLLLAGSATPPVLLQHIGHYDVYAFGAGLLLVVPTPWAAVAGGLMFGLTSVEQGVAAIAGLALVCAGLERPIPRRLTAAMVAVALAGGGTRLWLSSHDVVPRSDLLFERLTRSLEGVLRGGSAATWSWYGLAWLLVIAVVCFVLWDGVSRWRMACLLGGLLAIPAAATLVTLDGTRVFAVISWPALLVATQWLGERQDVGEFLLRGEPRLDAILSGLVGLWLVAPAYITWKGGSFILPWTDLLG